MIRLEYYGERCVSQILRQASLYNDVWTLDKITQHALGHLFD